MMADIELSGLAKVEKYYSDYGSRARELKDSGRKVIGYLSALCPVEILTAAGVVPIRLKGSVSEAVTKADAYMETMICPFVRNVFDVALKGKYGFLDGMVLSHQCDSIDRTYDVWSYNLGLPYWHFINYPHVTDDPSIAFTDEILRIFIRTLEKFTGRGISDQALAEAVRAHNENRQAMRALYELRKDDVPRISGTEMMKVLIAATSVPVDESTALIRSVIEEIKKRPPVSGGGKPRIMLVGDQIDDVAIVSAIEGAEAFLVMDDLSTGSKMYWGDVDATADPVRGITERYLKKLKFPTTFVAGETYPETLEARFGHMRQYIEDFRVNGAILFIYKYCDPYGFEVPAMKSFIESAGTPVLYIEDEYSTSSLGRVKTRIEAFLEMIA
ncbi:MAG TPA: 2-hydroxyacyl-CoA dehydratase family protein [Acidobacteriota bacterium]|nr:2-hydroxyacyl-CoA dehydratase family protein [Acidobacteriota bacterium]